MCEDVHRSRRAGYSVHGDRSNGSARRLDPGSPGDTREPGGGSEDGLTRSTTATFFTFLFRGGIPRLLMACYRFEVFGLYRFCTRIGPVELSHASHETPEILVNVGRCLPDIRVP